MQTDKDNPATGTEPGLESEDSLQESTLNWLLEQDHDEPSENLFVVDKQDPVDLSLSAFEAEIAARPMVRGRAGADDFDSYVAEEIVISSDAGSDIYTSSTSPVEAGQDDDSMGFDEPMALDFSQRRFGEVGSNGADVVDGSDILGLDDDDDIGETFLVIKRTKKTAAAETAPAARSPAESETVEPDEPTPFAAQTDMPMDVYSEAPHLTSDATATPVATDDGSFEEIIDVEEIVATAASEPGDVQDYINRVAAPTDDQAFDDYLTAGSEMLHGEEDIEELSLEPEDGELAENIDYHEDFRSLAEVGEKTMAAVTPLIAPLMEELSVAVTARLAGLGKPVDAVTAEFSLAADNDSAELARAQGYQPISEVCAAIPDCLQDLTREQMDAVFLSLTWVESGKPCNRLFLDENPDPFRGDAQGHVAVDDIAAGETPEATSKQDMPGDDAWMSEALALEGLNPDGLTPEGRTQEDEDIDALFDDFDNSAADLELDVPIAEEPQPESGSSVPDLKLIAGGRPDSGEDVPQVFDEDIFDTELIDQAMDLQAATTEDLDALFNDLGPDVGSGDDICGVDLQEFADAGSAPELQEMPAAESPNVPDSVVAPAAAGEDMSWAVPEHINFSYSSPSSGEIFAEFLDAFIEEGSSELEKLEDAVTRWETDAGDEAAYTAVTRILHTIKGIAKGVGLHYYGTLIHNFETLLDGLPRPQADDTAGYFRVINAWLDAAVRGMDHIQSERVDIHTEFPYRGDARVEGPSEVIDSGTPEVCETETESVPTQDQGAAAPSVSVTKRREQDKQLADEGARALAAQQSVRITSEKLDLLLNLTNQAQQLGVRTAQSTNRNKRASAELQGRLSSVRAHISDIADRALFNVTARGAGTSTEMDALEMDQYSEIQEAANILREGVEDLADLIELASRHNAQAEALLKQQATVISSIGSSIRAARVVPVSRLMPGLRRLVRTVSNDLNKEVAFRVINEVGTLDRDDYARCQTIMEHMVRNALDHGIESAEERTAAGKPSVGQVTIDVRMSGADSLIVLSDDGRGIDPEAMRESALRKGLDVDVDALSDEEALKLIFHKGFSTAQALSQISGRGVGMDIVLSELQQMGGDINILSEVGKGTSFHIRIPTNVTVNGALLVTAGESSYAIPLGGLIAVDEVPVDDFFAAVEQGSRLTLSGKECEPAYLGSLCQSGNLPDRSSWRTSIPVIVAGTEQRHMAIAVDDVEEALELVIRSLGAQFASVPGVAGAATTADGEAVVALDLNVLVACFDEGRGTAVAIEQAEEEQFLALVVDDSRTQRMVATSQLETVGIETATAENGAVAIDWLNTTESLPDIILLDVEMPVKDGIQTLREIRKSARYSHVPVIMVTSRTGAKHRTLAEQAGCNGYMGKPFNFRMLIGQINELTGHRLELGQ